MVLRITVYIIVDVEQFRYSTITIEKMFILRMDEVGKSVYGGPQS
jgi:hypothetical protein